MSGIAALLLPGGRTVHSRFHLPVPTPLDNCHSNIKGQSVAARLLRDATVLVWDEAPTASRAMFEAVDRCLQDLLGNCRLFGGKTILLGGDFRQIPSVLRYIDRDSIRPHTLTALPWWQDPHNVKRISLTQNMRAITDAEFADFCLRIGNGTYPIVSETVDGKELDGATIELPHHFAISADATARDLLDWVYAGHATVKPAQWHQFYSKLV